MYKKLTQDFGYIPMTTQADQDALMDIGIYHLQTDEEVTLLDDHCETVVLPLEASVEINWEQKRVTVSRQSLFDESPHCLHVCKGVAIHVKAIKESMILVQKTNNDKLFDAQLYTPEHCKSENAGEGVWQDTAFRTIRTIFDYSTAPYSNLVIGEVISHPGRWSSYPPHTHLQPEVYYYRFDKSQGFGCAMVDQEAYRIEDHSFMTIPGNLDHPQSTAPGYAMYFCWMIRHLDNNPWTERIYTDEHKWLLESNPSIWSPSKE
jgi:5-deoxy-glucuronate isomerase